MAQDTPGFNWTDDRWYQEHPEMAIGLAVIVMMLLCGVFAFALS